MINLAPPLVGPYDPIRQDLTAVEHVFNDELVSEFPFINELCDRVRPQGGKMLRPALLLLAGKAAGELSSAHHTLAAVVEMVHVATLLHDDVLDGADERRRRPSVSVTSGNVAAVLLGDYLVSHAFRLCSALDSPYATRRIAATTNTVCEGELLQNYHRGNDRLSEPEYLDIIRRKTAALTATSCELGGHYAGADRSLVQAVRAYGLSAGVAFQIIDDVLDLVGDRQRVGKTLGLDLALGKLTLPTIHCLDSASPATASALRAALTGKTPYDGRRLREWLDEAGSVEYAISVAAGYIDDALRQLEPIPPSDAKTSLVALAELIVQRQF